MYKELRKNKVQSECFYAIKHISSNKFFYGVYPNNSVAWKGSMIFCQYFPSYKKAKEFKDEHNITGDIVLINMTCILLGSAE